MQLDKKSVPNMLFGISVEVSSSNSDTWISSGIKWSTCTYMKNGSKYKLPTKALKYSIMCHCRMIFVPFHIGTNFNHHNEIFVTT